LRIFSTAFAIAASRFSGFACGIEQSNATVRRLLGASTAYLPLLLIALAFDRISRRER